jgi:hypothetical protein
VEGPIRIKKTRLPGPDVLVARLSGRVNAKVSVVKIGRKFYFKGPKAMGGICEVPADHLVDALNYKIWESNLEIKRKAK